MRTLSILCCHMFVKEPRLKTRPEVITWDKTGQVNIEVEIIPTSNISDLVSDALRSRKIFNPTGAKKFFQAFTLNVPKDLVRNQERWKQVMGETSSARATPNHHYGIPHAFRAF